MAYEVRGTIMRARGHNRRAVAESFIERSQDLAELYDYIKQEIEEGSVVAIVELYAIE